MLPEDLVQLLRGQGGAYDFENREWVLALPRYREIAQLIANWCRGSGVDLDPISGMSFDLLEYKVPFSDESKKNLIGYDFK